MIAGHTGQGILPARLATGGVILPIPVIHLQSPQLFSTFASGFTSPKMNTLTISKRLIKAGMQPATAEEQAQILAEITAELATKQDIERLEQRFQQRFGQMEKMIRDQATSTRWMMGIMFVALSLLLGALKLF